MVTHVSPEGSRYSARGLPHFVSFPGRQSHFPNGGCQPVKVTEQPGPDTAPQRKRIAVAVGPSRAALMLPTGSSAFRSTGSTHADSVSLVSPVPQTQD